MITVLTGTQKMPFTRLVDNVIDYAKNSSHSFVVQSGAYVPKYEVPNNVEIFSYCSQEALSRLIERSDVVVTHAGTGSVVGALLARSKVIVVPRLKMYGEHNDDHQVEIAELFEGAGYVEYWRESERFCDVFDRTSDATYTPYVSTSDKLLQALRSEIDRYMGH